VHQSFVFVSWPNTRDIWQPVDVVPVLLVLLPVRREALRFRHAMEEAQEQLGRTTEDNSRLRAELQAASTELAAVEAFANQR
jgi:hypothetical protein